MLEAPGVVFDQDIKVSLLPSLFLHCVIRLRGILASIICIVSRQYIGLMTKCKLDSEPSPVAAQSASTGRVHPPPNVSISFLTLCS